MALFLGCNPKVKNLEGLLPRQIAKDSGHKAAAKELGEAQQSWGKASKGSSTGLNTSPWALTLYDWSHEHEATLHDAFGDASDTVSADAFISALEDLKAPVGAEQLHAVVVAHGERREGFLSIDEFVKGVKYIHKSFLLSSYSPKKKKVNKGGKAKKNKKRGKFTLPVPVCTMPPELVERRGDGGPPRFMIEKYQNCTDVKRFNREHPPEHPIEDDSAWYLDEPEKVYINVNYCAKSGDLKSLDRAFSQGVPVDVTDTFYQTPLMAACSSGNYKVAQYLLSLR